MLDKLPMARTTLPDTNTLAGARTAQLWLAKDGIKATIWHMYDVWMLEAPDCAADGSFMNVPVRQRIS